MLTFFDYFLILIPNIFFSPWLKYLCITKSNKLLQHTPKFVKRIKYLWIFYSSLTNHLTKFMKKFCLITLLSNIYPFINALDRVLLFTQTKHNIVSVNVSIRRIIEIYCIDYIGYYLTPFGMLTYATFHARSNLIIAMTFRIVVFHVQRRN